MNPSQQTNTDEFLPGTVLDERFEIKALLGTGGMGHVYQARHLQLEQTVALKVLSRKRIATAHSHKRFINEAKLMSSIAHPNVVHVKTFGVLQNGQPYLVMDYLEGCNLHDLVAREGKLKPSRVITIFRQLCDGLAYAHNKGIIHRDLKPGNIMLCNAGTPDERAVIVDFGVAKLLHEGGGGICASSAQSLTQTGNSLGSPAYMSPEQTVAARTVDRRADIYALGCMMYLCLTGRLPFEADNIVQLVTMHANAIPPPMEAVPIALGQAVLKAMEKSPENRYQTIEELRSALQESQVSIHSIGCVQARSEKRPFMGKTGKLSLSRILGVLSVLLIATILVFGATQNLKQVQERNQDDTLKAMVVDAQQAFKEKRFKSAEEKFAVVARLQNKTHPEDTRSVLSIYLGWGESLLAQGKAAAVIPIASSAERTSGGGSEFAKQRAQACYLVGAAYYELDQMPAAVHWLRKAVTTMPDGERSECFQQMMRLLICACARYDDHSQPDMQQLLDNSLAYFEAKSARCARLIQSIMLEVQRHGNQRAIARLICETAKLKQATGDDDAALTLCRQALALRQEIHDSPVTIWQNKVQLGRHYFHAGQLIMAEKTLREAYASVESGQLQVAETELVTLLLILGDVDLHAEKYADAQKWTQRSIDLCLVYRLPDVAFNAKCQLSRIHSTMGNTRDALKSAERLYSQSRSAINPQKIIIAGIVLAEVYASNNMMDKSAELYKVLLAVIEQKHMVVSPPTLGNLHLARASALMDDSHHRNECIREAQAAVDCYMTDPGSYVKLAAAYMELGSAESLRNHFEPAVSSFEKALELYRKHNDDGHSHLNLAYKKAQRRIVEWLSASTDTAARTNALARVKSAYLGNQKVQFSHEDASITENSAKVVLSTLGGKR